VDQEHRNSHLDHLRRQGEEEAISQILDRCYADRSRMLAELDSLGFVTEVRQLTTYVHLIWAKLG